MKLPKLPKLQNEIHEVTVNKNEIFLISTISRVTCVRMYKKA